MGQIKAFLKEEDGVGVVEIILILVVLISLVLIFKSQLTSLVTSIFGKIVSQSGGCKDSGGKGADGESGRGGKFFCTGGI